MSIRPGETDGTNKIRSLFSDLNKMKEEVKSFLFMCISLTSSGLIRVFLNLKAEISDFEFRKMKGRLAVSKSNTYH